MRSHVVALSFRVAMAFRAPLLGYNTNVRHKGRLYHIQTEDSGVGHPHVITHLFADGGRIVGSRKTSYAQHLNAEGLQETVKKLMQAQHKAMFIALRDGVYDEGPAEIPGEQTGTVQVDEALGQTAEKAAPDAAAAKRASEKPSEPTRSPEARRPLYQGTVPAVTSPAAASVPAAPRQSIFGSDLTSEKSLDEVILSYLATDDKDA